jgi:hypothetical protein
LPVLYTCLTSQDRVNHTTECLFWFTWILLSVECSQQCNDSLFDSLLNEPELFITLTPEYLAKQCHIMVIFLEHFDSIDDSSSPFNDEILETISLIQISVHVLLHCLSWQSILLTLLVIFSLLSIDIIDEIPQLPQSQWPMITSGHTTLYNILAKEFATSTPLDPARRCDRPDTVTLLDSLFDLVLSEVRLCHR